MIYNKYNIYSIWGFSKYPVSNLDPFVSGLPPDLLLATFSGTTALDLQGQDHDQPMASLKRGDEISSGSPVDPRNPWCQQMLPGCC